MNTSHGVAGAEVRSQESQGSASRLVDLIIDPPRAFHGISDRAPWVLAFSTAVVMRFASLLVFYQPAVTVGKLVGSVVFQIGTVAPPILLGAAVVLVVAHAWGVRVRWGAAFSVVAHVYVAYTLATIAVASVAGAILPDSGDLDLRNPPFTNLAFLLTDSGSELAKRVVAELDVRAAYAVLLLWLGLRGAVPAAPRGAAVGAAATVAVVKLAGVAAVQMMR